jgi:hypothetical protein
MEHVDGCTVETSSTPARPASAELTGHDLVRAVTGGEAPRSWFGTGWVEACFRLIMQVPTRSNTPTSRGVIHRDIKPTNIMITRTGPVVLLDFGLASAQGAHKLTRSGAMVGSLPYMAPEQVQGKIDAIDARTDVYALGVTLYEMLTLHSPYLAEDSEVTRRHVLEGRPRAIRECNPSVPWDAETVCLTAMERDPQRRYGSAALLARDLENVLELRPIEARPPGPLLRLQRFAQRHPAWTVGALLGAAVVIGGPLALWSQQRAANRRIQQALDDTTRERDAAPHRSRARRGQLLPGALRRRAAARARRRSQPRRRPADGAGAPPAAAGRARLRREVPRGTSGRCARARRRGTAPAHARDHRDAPRPSRGRAQALRTLGRDPLRREREAPANRDADESLGETCNDLGVLQWTMGSLDAATASFHRAIEIFERLTAEEPESTRSAETPRPTSTSTSRRAGDQQRDRRGRGVVREGARMERDDGKARARRDALARAARVRADRPRQPPRRRRSAGAGSRRVRARPG